MLALTALLRLGTAVRSPTTTTQAAQTAQTSRLPQFHCPPQVANARTELRTLGSCFVLFAA
eukprot:2207157-Alexandrium_andersonii.AAC.1